ncbi:SusC/RagA family TonB-linked outer membrane protein [Chryseobacterium sp. SL1]|nr:SusC/RagA family TonB-linked outer membrane protein [Chryseobacterium sp. SL1]
MLLIAFMQISLAANAQKISLSKKNAALTEVFRELKKQSGYGFMINREQIRVAKPVTINSSGDELEKILDKCFEGQPFTYKIEGKMIVVVDKGTAPVKNELPQMDVSGRVVDEDGKPLAGASIFVKGTSQSTSSGNDGSFTLKNVADNAVITISYVGYRKRELKAVANLGAVILEVVNSQLDQVQVIAYGTTTKRLNTGSVGSISGADIAKQPVSNPLAALSGRIPGLVVTQSTGVPGSSFNIQIRGRNSIAQGSQPLILIDGIPFAPGNEGISSLPSALTNGVTGTSLSPFNSINPSDIESIDILKDADATAIYGSRGANGVVLITTRKGKAGKTQVTANFNQGFTEVGRTMEVMNTQQYLEMRKEAFINSNITPTIANAPDLLAWDQNRYTNYKNELIGGTGKLTNAQLSLSGGSSEIQYLIGGSFYRETAVFPDALPNTRGAVHTNLTHRSKDQRFNITMSASYTAGLNRSAAADFTRYTFLSPNTPDFFTADGKLKWLEGGIQYENPYRYLFQTYTANTNNLVSSLNTSYKILDELTLKVAIGYNQLTAKEKKLSPVSSLAPNQNQIGTSNFARSEYSSWNIEPQLEYQKEFWKGKLNILLGGTVHQKKSSSESITASGFTTEALMESLQAASTISYVDNSFAHYKYQALFARVNYNIEDKYLVNLTARRDGSSRFGRGKQYANFGAVGAAWIFSAENWFKNLLPIFSFGKLRGSYGITGNDQIGDYQFLDSWQAGIQTYEGTATLIPSGLYNPDYSWEVNKKLEGAFDLGLWDNRILISIGYYRNRSSNQLVAYRLPYLTGFASIIRNFPAFIQNDGWEFTANADILKRGQLKWSIAFNATIPRNKLLSFPGIESSTYASVYKVSESLNSIYGYKYTGIDTTTGIYTFSDVDGNGSYNSKDYVISGRLDPKFYGGITNTVSYKGLELSIFFDYRKQMGRNILYSMYTNSMVPGMLWNQPAILTDRWTTANNSAEYEKYTAIMQSTADRVSLSDRVYSDQSFLRLRNLSLSYLLPIKAQAKTFLNNTRIYAQGQNLVTWNRQRGFDPETQNLYSLPPLRIFTLGLQTTF